MFKFGFFSFTLLVIVFENAVAITDDQKAQIQSKFLITGAECIKDHPLTADDITAFKSKTFPDGENAGCFAACIFKKLGLIDDQGTLSHDQGVENAKKIFEDEDELKNVSDFLTTCSKVNDEEVSDGEKGCDRAKLTFNCLTENSETFGFNIDF